MPALGIDIETYSSKDIAESGAYAYAEAPDFQILLIGYRFDDQDETTVIDLSGVSKEEAPDYVYKHYRTFYKALTASEVLKTAFNANFERTCLAQYFGPMPPEQWQCTMIRAARLGLPMSLSGVGKALGLPEDKQKLAIGKSLIQFFCKPCKPTKANGGRTRNLPEHDQEKWQQFIEYNARDVDAEQEILSIIDSYGRMDPKEQRLWEWDQRMNDHGVLLDVPYIKGILEYDASHTKDLQSEAIRITGLENPNSVTQLGEWLKEQGVDMDGVTKETVADALKRKDLSLKTRRVLQLRQALGKTSTKKYQAMLNAVCKDDRLRGILQFYGASRTGRWAGRIVQTHNLPQNHIDDIEYCRELVAKKDFEAVEMIWGETSFIFSQLIRTAFVASPGSRFVVCDFSAVEARIIAWLAGEEWRMDVFRDGGDIYCASASRMFKVPVVKHGENGHLRQKGKIAELALGYQGGVGAMKRMDSAGSIPEEEMQDIVAQWRDASPNIVKLWKKMETAAKTAIKEKRPRSKATVVQVKYRDPERARENEEATGAEAGTYSEWFLIGAEGVKFYMKKNALFMVLPSGRELCYWDAKVEQMEDGREHISYAGINQETKQWTRTETYGGKLTENCVQAIGRDCLAEAMLRVDGMGYQIVMHVHDEMIADVPDEDTEAYNRISGAMAVTPSWAPGLVLRGDGYETKFYMKD